MKDNHIGLSIINVSENEAGQRIDNFLHTYLKGVPRSMIYRIVRKGAVRVNKKRIKPEYRLQLGNTLRIPAIRPPFRNRKQENPLIFTQLDNNICALIIDSILYEDDHLLVLNKPSGISVHGGSGLRFGVIEGLRALRPQAHFLELVHRLDRETSGVLLVAKKRSSLRTLHKQLRLKEIRKDYLALVRGHWKCHTKVVAAPLLKNILANKRRMTQVNSAGKPSETRFQIEEKFTLATLVKATPVTGRTHQIRVHAQYMGHPIAFDNRYGDKKFNQQLKKEHELNRLFLHASTLHFTHPDHGKSFKIEAPLDELLCSYLFHLRTHHKWPSPNKDVD